MSDRSYLIEFIANFIEINILGLSLMLQSAIKQNYNYTTIIIDNTLGGQRTHESTNTITDTLRYDCNPSYSEVPMNEINVDVSFISELSSTLQINYTSYKC